MSIFISESELPLQLTVEQAVEAAYAGISLPRRRWLHRRVAEALAHLYSTELDGVSGQIVFTSGLRM